MNHITALAALLTLAACTQAATPPTDAPVGDAKNQLTTGAPAAVQAVSATTPILSLLVGNSVTASAKGAWCVKDGTPPFTKISIQDTSIAAPIENQSAPLPGANTAKDTATQQAPGTATVTSQTSDSAFKIQWLRSGIKGDAQITVQGDSLTFADDAGSSTFTRCQ